MNSRIKKDYKLLFNDDGFCTFSNASKYQDINKPVGLSQVYGYVDEVVDAGCDLFLLCPNMYQLPGWDSAHYPYWRNTGKIIEFPKDTAVGKVLTRAQEFYLAGNDLIQLSLDRARKRGIDFFITWRMNECHGIDDESLPNHSKFWRENPQFRIGGDENKIGRESKALCFIHKEVRDYQFGFIKELCESYDIDGLELDFLRFPFFFPKKISFNEKAPIMTQYIRRIRDMLDGLGKDIPICARVHNRLDFARDMGLDIKACVDEGLIDMINISPFYITQPEGDIESFRKLLLDTKLYAEITQCAGTPKHIELSVEESRKSTTEQIRSIAYSFFERGADGISLFNFVYYRDYSFGHPAKIDRCEPNFKALKNICDRSLLAREEKHYYINENVNFSKQLPAILENGRNVKLKIHVADNFNDDSIKSLFSKSILRIESNESATDSKVNAYLDGTMLRKTIYEEELFDQPYKGGIPDNHNTYKDFLVPISELKKGWNEFEFKMMEGKPITIVRMELALYH